MNDILTGFGDALTFANMVWILLGVALGYLVGAIPGLGKSIATAIAIPLTFYLSPISAIAFLLGIAKGSAAGNAVSAILINTPGEASSTPTAMAGYPMAKSGKARKALKMALFASVIGDIGGTLVLILVAQPMAKFALLIGPVELTALLAFSLLFIAGLSGRSLLKGCIAGFVGILLSTVGLEIETASPRFTFGMIELFDGLPIIAVAIGMLALSEAMVQAGDGLKPTAKPVNIETLSARDNGRLTREDWKKSVPALSRGLGIGVGVGVLPGLGASVASFMSYSVTRNRSNSPQSFEKDGAIEGVAAAEVADNAVVPSSLVPLFAIGIPGSVIAAILIAAFTIHGVTPGPSMFVEHARLMYAIYASMIIASIALLVVGLLGANVFSRVVTLSPRIIVPVVVFFCALGTFIQSGGLFGVAIAVIFGVFGFLCKKYDYSFVTFIIGFVLGPYLELSLRQSLALVQNFDELLDHPIALVVGAVTILGIWRLGRRSFHRTKSNSP